MSYEIPDFFRMKCKSIGYNGMLFKPGVRVQFTYKNFFSSVPETWDGEIVQLHYPGAGADQRCVNVKLDKKFSRKKYRWCTLKELKVI